MVFDIEQQRVYQNKSGELGGLIDDVHNCPIIDDLMESCKISPAVFDSKNERTKNIFFVRSLKTNLFSKLNERTNKSFFVNRI